MKTDLADPMPSLDQFLNRLDKLHSSPTVALRVMQITRNPEFEMHAVAECLELDPALAASILRLVNSSYYGLVDEVTSLPHALTYLGRRSLRLAVLSFGLVKTLVSGAPSQFHQNYWKRSLTMAAAARECTRLMMEKSVDADTAFAAGLVSDLGMLAMAQLETEKYMEIAGEPDHTIELARLERQTFGFDHMAVSQRLMSRWQMPSELIEAVGNHHTYLPVSAPLNHVVLIANLVTEIIWTPACPYIQPLLQVLKRQLDLSIDDLIALVESTEKVIEEGKQIFGVQLQEEIDLDAVEKQARVQFGAAANDLAAEPGSLEAFLVTPVC